MSAKAMHPSAQNEPEPEPEELNEILEYLTTRERCDQCGSQSYYKIVFKQGELFLCYHHYKSHEDMLFEVAEDIVDESELLHRR